MRIENKVVEFKQLKTIYKSIKNVGVNKIYNRIANNQPVKANKIASNFKNITQRAVERYIKQLKYECKIEFKSASKIVGMWLRTEIKNRQKSEFSRNKIKYRG